MKTEFVTCLNCIDGRVQLPVINWILENYDVKYVDMITEPGVDGLISDKMNNIQDILEKINVSKEGHSTNQIFIVGHHDCLANPVDDQKHIEEVTLAVENLKNKYLDCDVTGLWVDDSFEVCVVHRS